MSGNKLSGREKIKIAYKLLHDLLFAMVIFFILVIIGDGLLPGIMSSHIGFYKIIIAMLFTVLLINLTSKKVGVAPTQVLNKKIKYALLFVLAALIFNGMRGIGLPVNIFILFLALITLYLFYKIFFTTTTNL